MTMEIRSSEKFWIDFLKGLVQEFRSPVSEISEIAETNKSAHYAKDTTTETKSTITTSVQLPVKPPDQPPIQLPSHLQVKPYVQTLKRKASPDPLATTPPPDEIKLPSTVDIKQLTVVSESAETKEKKYKTTHTADIDAKNDPETDSESDTGCEKSNDPFSNFEPIHPFWSKSNRSRHVKQNDQILHQEGNPEIPPDTRDRLIQQTIHMLSTRAPGSRVDSSLVKMTILQKPHKLDGERGVLATQDIKAWSNILMIYEGRVFIRSETNIIPWENQYLFEIKISMDRPICFHVSPFGSEATAVSPFNRLVASCGCVENPVIRKKRPGCDVNSTRSPKSLISVTFDATDSDMANGVAEYVNDYRSLQPHENVVFYVALVQGQPFLVAVPVRDIKTNEEILIDYGDRYCMYCHSHSHYHSLSHYLRRHPFYRGSKKKANSTVKVHCLSQITIHPHLSQM